MRKPEQLSPFGFEFHGLLHGHPSQALKCEAILGAEPNAYSADLDEVEAYLNRPIER